MHLVPSHGARVWRAVGTGMPLRGAGKALEWGFVNGLCVAGRATRAMQMQGASELFHGLR